MRFKNLLCTAVSTIFLTSILVSGCSKDLPPGDYDAKEVGKVKKVIPGVIVSARAVHLHQKNTGEENTKATLFNGSMAHSHGYEYVIRLNNGGVISLVQTDDIQLKPKEHILVIYGKNTRVVPDHSDNSL